MKKLSKMTSIKTEAKDIPDFFQTLKERTINKCIEMGLDYIEVKDFLDDKHIAENNIETILDNIHN